LQFSLKAASPETYEYTLVFDDVSENEFRSNFQKLQANYV